MYNKYYSIQYNTDSKSYNTKAEALRNAAKLSKIKRCVVKVYDSQDNFIKSFDGR